MDEDGELMAVDTRTKQERIEEIKKADANVKTMEDFTSPDVLYQELIDSVKKYHPSGDISMIEKAYKIAYDAHKDQRRKSGEPYIIHPLCVGIILADLELDKETIVAGLLHDVVEDTVMTSEELKEEFGEEVELLVDGVTKLGQLSYSADKVEVQAENLRKMFLAMAKDIRVILIKLADRLHNMRTLKYMKPEKQKEKARETMDIYAPIAHRLGISKIKVELDDLSLKYLEPEVYYDLVEKIALKKDARQADVNSIVEDVSKHIEAAGIKAQIDGRIKHFFSIYKKMVNQQKTLDQIYDLFAVRIIVDTVKDCYAALGVIHEMYKPIPGRFKDYIAMPKQNMYQSLHTTLIGPNGAGKTTILKSIIRQLSPIAGMVYLDGRQTAQMTGKELSRCLSVVLTERVRPELMTCRDVVATGRYPYTGRFGVLGEQDHRAVEEAMELVQIRELSDRDFAKISDGQRQRVMLARAVCQEPDILVLDEPTSFLDIKYKLEFLSVLQQLKRSGKLTVIMSLHELDLAERISDRIACIRKDRIDRFGTPEEIFVPGYIPQLYDMTSGSYDERTGNIELEPAKGRPQIFVLAGNGTGTCIYRRLQR